MGNQVVQGTLHRKLSTITRQLEMKELKLTPQEAKELLDNLFEIAMQGHWKEVVKLYKEIPEARKKKITKSADTALHIAVSAGQTEVALELVEIIDEEELCISNEKENTPLHIAAELGNVEVCHSIISRKSPNLCPLRNCEGETPLFLAARHGGEKAFLCLHDPCQNKYPFIRNNNGDTILHAAISGEHFSLAFKIINYYPDLVNSINVNGLSPLHILANKPNAFKSSSRLRLFDRLIYHCIIVEELIVEEREIFATPKTVDDENKYPENYETCIDFFQLLRNAFGVLVKTPERKMSTASDEGRKKKSNTSSDEENLNNNCSLQGVNQQERTKGRKYNSFPSNYQSFVLLSKLIMKSLLIILGMGIWRIRKIHEKKECHVWANQIMSELVERTSSYKYDSTGTKPLISTQPEFIDPTLPENAPSDHDTSITQDTSGQPNHSQKEHEQTEKQKIESGNIETPILIAAKMGVTEMVAKILDKFPVAIQDLNSENKNVLLLAIENRQPHVYKLLQNSKNIQKESVFRQLDNQGNSALHLAATFGKYRPWLIPGSALQIKWEIKWYKFVKNSMPRRFFDRYNRKFQTPKAVFIDTHKELVKDGSEWLTKTAESCSLVAALIAAVAFATSTTVPGGVEDENGEPRFRNEPEFKVFAIASLVALCFSVTSLVFFLSILTSRFQPKDFEIDLPRKLLIGLTSLFASIGSMLISFCAGHVFLLNKQLRPVAYPLYAATCFPITFFAFAQLSLYIDLMWAIFKKVPQRSYNAYPE